MGVRTRKPSAKRIALLTFDLSKRALCNLLNDGVLAQLGRWVSVLDYVSFAHFDVAVSGGRGQA